LRHALASLRIRATASRNESTPEREEYADASSLQGLWKQSLTSGKNIPAWQVLTQLRGICCHGLSLCRCRAGATQTNVISASGSELALARLGKERGR